MRRVIVAAGLCTALAGCGRELDTHKVEQQLPKTLGQGNGVEIQRVACPGNRTAKKGDRFQCTATLADGRSVPVVVTQTDDNGKYTASFLAGSLPVDAKTLAMSLQRRVAAQGIELASVTCPGGIRAKTGTTVDCDVRDTRGGTGKIAVTFTDDSGSYRFAVR